MAETRSLLSHTSITWRKSKLFWRNWRSLALALALGSAGVGDKADVVVRLTLRQDLKSNGVRRLLIFSDRDLGVVGVGVLASAFPRLKVFRLITRAS